MPDDVLFTPVVGAPPKLPPQHLPRAYLVTRILKSLVDSPIVLLQAPAGYGKTVVLAECLAQMSSPVVYVRLEPNHHDAPALVRTHIRDQAGSNGIGSKPTAGKFGQPQSIIEGFEKLRSRVSQAGEPVTLVVDDYPATASEAFNHQVHSSLANLPSDWCVIISSRGQPELPLGRWSAEGRVAIYTDKDLAFTSAETAQLAVAILGRELEPREVDLLQQHFAGWVLGLKLFITACQSLSPVQFQQVLEVERGLTWTVDEYLDSEVMQSLIVDPGDQDFVYQTSILSDLAVEICNEFVGISDSGERLRSLERRGAFVTRLDTLGSVYEYQPAFRHFLQARLRRRKNSATIAALHLQAAQAYETRSLWLRAIEHYLEGGAPDHAAQLLATHGYDLLHQPCSEAVLPYLQASISHNPVQTILDQLAGLPSAVIETNPSLLLLRVQALRAQRAYDQIPRLLLQASERVQQVGIALDEVRVAVEWAWALFGEGRYREAVERLNQTLAVAEHEPGVHAEALLALSVNLYASGDIAAGREVGEQALHITQTVPTRTTRLDLEMQVAHHLAEVYGAAGEWRLALEMADRACSINTDDKIGGLTQYLDNLDLAMRLRVERGDFEAARSIGDQWQRLLDTNPTSLATRTELSWLRSQMALVEHEYSQAEAWLAGIPTPRVMRVQLCLAQGQFEEALLLAEQEWAEHGRDQEPLRHFIAQAWLGIVERQQGKVEQGRQLLEDSVSFFREKGLGYWQAGAELHLAEVLSSSGETVLGRQHLAVAFEYGAREEVSHFSFWYPKVIAWACTQAIDSDIQPAYALDLALRRLTDEQASSFRPLLDQSLSNMAGLRRPLSSWEMTPPSGLLNSSSYGQAVETLVAEGRLTPEGASKLVEVYQLTPRQIEVFVWYIDPNIRVEQRRVNEAIAERLVLSQATVRDYISTILRKLGAAAKDRLQLRTWAIAERLIPS